MAGTSFRCDCTVVNKMSEVGNELGLFSVGVKEKNDWFGSIEVLESYGTLGRRRRSSALKKELGWKTANLKGGKMRTWGPNGSM